MNFQIGDTKYKIAFSFFAVITLSLIITGNNIVLLSVLSAVLHECGHLSAMYYFKNPPCAVELGAFGIRIEKTDSSDVSFFKEAVIAAGGIAVNLFLALLSFICYLLFLRNIFLEIIFINLFIALFNSIPMEMLDMGKIIENLLLMKYSDETVYRIISKISFATLLIFAVGYIFYVLYFGINISFTAVIIYLILINMKRRKFNDKQGN